MSKVLLAVAIVAAVVSLVLANAAHGATPGIKGGKFEVTCKFSNHNQIDPIVSPGLQMSAHLHEFFGNRNVTPDSTPGSIRGLSTTCTIGQDAAAYWVPAAYRTDTGQLIQPTKVFAYYFGDPAGPVATPPENAEIVAGDSHATGVQGANVIQWSCGNGGKSHSPVRTTPYDCTTTPNVVSQGVVAIIKFPYCWDGQLAAGNDSADFAYGDSQGVCQAPFTTRLPQLQVHVHYGNSVSSPGFQRGDLIQLSSDQVMGETGGVTEHADWMNAWDQSKLNALVQGCLSVHKDCGFLTKSNPGPS